MWNSSIILCDKYLAGFRSTFAALASRTVARKSSVGGLYVCAGGLDIEN